MDTIIFRKLNLDDYEQFLLLINDFRNTSFTIDQFKNTFNTMTNCETYVLEKDYKLIATGKLLYEHKFIFNISCLAHIEDVCVKQEFRTKGYGKLIIDKLVNIAKEKKCYKVVLDCSDDNRLFYEKCNFEKRGNQMSLLL